MHARTMAPSPPHTHKHTHACTHIAPYLPACACRRHTQQAQLAGADPTAVSRVAELASAAVESILRDSSLTKSGRAAALQRVGARAQRLSPGAAAQPACGLGYALPCVRGTTASWT